MSILPIWQSFLRGSGAVFAAERLAHFGSPGAESHSALQGSVLVDLSHLALIAVSGLDAERLLQGQFTNDIRQLGDHYAQLSAWCSPKGRVLTNFLVFSRPNAYFLQLPQQMLESTLKRLRLYVLRADVQVVDASADLVRIGFSGLEPLARLQQELKAAPAAIDDVLQVDAVTVIRLRGVQPRYEIVGPLNAVQPLWRSLAEVARPVGASAWALLDIVAGLPTIYPETSDEFVPQMINWDLLGGISFTKGCYSGQEVIARTQYLGKLKRRLHLAHVDTLANLRPGLPLVADEGERARTIGKVINAEAHPDGGWELLVVIPLADTEHTSLHLGRHQGPELRLKPLPYATETEAAS